MPLSPIYVTVARFSVESKGDIPRILEGIKSAFNELAASINIKEERTITLGDTEVDGTTAFTPIDLGHGSSKLFRDLLQKHIPVTLTGKDDCPRVTLFKGCDGGPLLKLRPRTSKGQEQLGSLKVSTITLRPMVRGVVAQEGALVINLDD